MKKKKSTIIEDRKYDIISKIIEKYDQDFTKSFERSEFNDIDALEEIIGELKELNYLKKDRKKVLLLVY